MGKTYANIEEELQVAVMSGALTRYRLSKLSGVSEGQLSRFVMDKDDPRHRTLTLTSAARVAEVLGLGLHHLNRRQKHAKKGGQK